MKRKNIVAVTAGIFAAVLFIILIFHSVHAAETSFEIPLHHHHTDACMGDVTVIQETDGETSLRTISESTCPLCGGVVHDYLFVAECSCGERIERTGWACYHSIYGDDPAGCPTYSEVDFSTEHEHTERGLICDFEETDEVGRIGIKISETEPTKKLTLKASFSGLLPEPEYNWKSPDGSILRSSSISVKENGLYTFISVYSEDGKIYEASREIQINNIDLTGPEIVKIEPDEEKPTNGPVKFTITAQDLSAGLAEFPYSINGGIYQSENSFTAEKNGTYRITVSDSLGNKTHEKIIVKNIDLKPPVFTLSQTPETWEKGECKIMVNAGDPGLGLSDLPYSFDEGKTWTGENSLSLSKSQTVEIWVRDLAGNITKESMEVMKQEKKKPAPGKADSKEDENPKTSEEASEREERSEQDGTEDSKKDEKDEDKKKPEESGVTEKKTDEDNSNNPQIGEVLPETVIYEGSEVPDAKKDKETKGKKENKKSEKKKTEKEVKNGNNNGDNLNGVQEDKGAEDNTAADVTDENLTVDAPDETKEPVQNTSEEEVYDERTETPKKKNTLAFYLRNFRIGFLKIPKEIRVLGISTSALAGGTGAFFAGFFLAKSAGICWVDSSGKEHFLCRNIIRRRGEIYELKVDKRNLRNSETKDIRIHLPPIFSKLHRYRPLTIRFENTTVSQYVEKDISLRLP